MRRSQVSSFVLGAMFIGFVSLPTWAQTKTYTVDADFNGGNLNNVQEKPANQLILGRTPVSKTRNVWVDNYSEGWIVRINTVTGKQTARFDAALINVNGQPTGASTDRHRWDPGRVAVDTNGDVWIVNRARASGQQGTLSKFSGNIKHCIDRNGNGKIDTSRDVNNDGIVNPNDPKEYLGQNDECILTTVRLGSVNHVPRAVAIDKKGKVWAGTWAGHNIYRYNPNEPLALEATIPIRASKYGFDGYMYSAASGGDYMYFTSNRNWSSGGHVIQVNIDTLAVKTVACYSVYGIVADPKGGIAYAGAHNGSGVWKADFTKNPPTCTKPFATSGSTTAVTLDDDGNIWAAAYGSNRYYKFAPNGTELGHWGAQGARPHGLSPDFDGNIWGVNDSTPHTLVEFSKTGSVIKTPSIGGPSGYNYGPYLYSDFTGVQIDRQAPYTRVGDWSAIYDGGGPGIPWSSVTWNKEPQGAVPAETALRVSVRAADSLQALGIAAFKTAVNGGSLAGIVGRYVQVKTDLTGPGYKTPVMSDVSIKGPCDTLGEACCVKDADCDDGDSCTQDMCPAPAGKCQHKAIPECCNVDGDCNDGNICTNDKCPAPGGTCKHDAQPNCCVSYTDCVDGDTCTADVCPKPGEACGNPVIPGCCHSTADCDDGNACTTDVCPSDGELCTHTPIKNCCTTDADCKDNNLCTTDSCDTQTNTCTNTKIKDCCNLDTECFDGDTCTADRCSGPGGQCVFDKIPNCCTPNSPEVGDPCDPPQAPNNHEPCHPGKLVCENNAFVCKDALGPKPEKCDWIDNDCDGLVDGPGSCPVGTTCLNGVCVEECKSSEFPCDPGFQCEGNLCVPKTCEHVICETGKVCDKGHCVDTGDGGVPEGGTSDTGAGGQGAGGSAGQGTGGAAGQGSGASSGQGAAAGGSIGGSSGAGANTQADASTSGSSSTDGARNNYGLATGGGGCKCDLSKRDSGKWPGLLAIGLALGLLSRRRKNQDEQGGEQ